MSAVSSSNTYAHHQLPANKHVGITPCLMEYICMAKHADGERSIAEELILTPGLKCAHQKHYGDKIKDKAPRSIAGQGSSATLWISYLILSTGT